MFTYVGLRTYINVPWFFLVFFLGLGELNFNPYGNRVQLTLGPKKKFHPTKIKTK